MRCSSCGSEKNIELKGKIYCSDCGSVVYQPTRIREENWQAPVAEKYIAEPKVIESHEFASSPASYKYREPAWQESNEEVKKQGVNFKPFLLILTIVSIVFFVIMLFVFEPIVNLRSKIVKYTQSATEIERFREKISTLQSKAKAWDKNSYLAFVDLTENPSYKPVNFSIKDTYHSIFSSTDKKNVAIYFTRKNSDEIVGNIETDKKDIKIPSETDPYSAINMETVKYLPEEVFPMVEVNGLKKFLEIYPNASLRIGPVLEYSKKHGANYWLYYYKTADNKHKFIAKVSAENGQILEISQR